MIESPNASRESSLMPSSNEATLVRLESRNYFEELDFADFRELARR